MTIEPTYIDKGATFSPDRKYRYLLWRTWDKSLPSAMFLMLNPSTADENVLDPTLRRCVGYAMKWGYGRMDICNIFALRSTDPKELYKSEDPIGVDNDQYILKTAKVNGVIIAAWGNHGAHNNRTQEVVDLLTSPTVFELHALALTKTNQPVHPLYQRSDIMPVRYM